MSIGKFWQHDIRPAAVAGQFYPGEPETLCRMIEESFRSSLGPGQIPQVNPTGARKIFCIIVPHAGYQFSGPGAAWGYREVASDGQPAAVVILGVNHHGVGARIAVSAAKAWQTPLGDIPVAVNLRERMRNLFPDLTADDRAHALDHSVEVHVPFLQYLFGEIPVLPITIGGYLDLEKLQTFGVALATVSRETDLLVIASTDFSHFVSHAVAQEMDRMALDQIADVNAEGLYRIVSEHGITMCGVFPVTVALAAARERGITRAEILHYHTSGDVTGDTRNVVGYGSAVLRFP